MLSGFLRAGSLSFPQIAASESDSISGLVYDWTLAKLTGRPKGSPPTIDGG
jgi:hypothetical protein